MPKALTNPEATAARVRLSESDNCEDLSGWARSVLAEIRNGFRGPPAIRHPLGFTCLQLYRSTTWGLCMHIWESSEISPLLTTTPIHSHSWDLFSQVVCGQLENIKICVTDGSPFPTHRILEITSADGADLIHATQRLVNWTQSESVHVGVGQNYELPAGTFHMSRPCATGLTATVLLAEYRHPSPELALGRLDYCDRVVARTVRRPRDLRLMADAALRELTEDSAGGTVDVD
jgi:hypothetical protein